MMERNDPTRAGFTPPATDVVRLSCNEVESLCFKAARGSGLSWGLAEEGGFAGRWLYTRGIDGPGALLAHMDYSAGLSSDLLHEDRTLRSRAGNLLCPIAIGASLSDFASLGQVCALAGRVDRPVLLLPFIHQVAIQFGDPVTLAWAGGCVSVSPEGEVAGDLDALVVTESAEITLEPGKKVKEPIAAPRDHTLLDGDTLARLNAYAMLTNVPASERSRADAGSSDGDND